MLLKNQWLFSKKFDHGHNIWHNPIKVHCICVTWLLAYYLHGIFQNFVASGLQSLQSVWSPSDSLESVSIRPKTFNNKRASRGAVGDDHTRGYWTVKSDRMDDILTSTITPWYVFRYAWHRLNPSRIDLVVDLTDFA